jgi:hypothetical protein
MTVTLPLLIASLVILAGPDRSMATGAAASIIGVLDSSFDAGVGCSFRTMVKPGQLVWTDMDARMQDGPWAHIDGRPQKLEVLGKLEWPDKKGRSVRFSFRAEKARVYLDVQLTRGCEDLDNPKQCAGVAYAGTMSAISNGVRQTIKIDGGCGD